MEQASANVIEAQPDYITVTCADGPRAFGLRAICYELVEVESERGNKATGFTRWGYQGETCGLVTWGSRPDGVMAQVAGPLAAVEFSRLYPIATNISRLDLAATVALDGPHPDLARSLYDQGRTATRHAGFPLNGTIIERWSGGGTFYLGSRSSELFARVYDKHAESGDARYKDAWRWELEAKGTMAKRIAERLWDQGDRPAFCASYVHQHFTRRGLPPQWDCRQPVDPELSIHPPTTAARRIGWLQNGVKPAFQWLQERGYHDEAVMALGLDEPWNIKRAARGLELREKRSGHALTAP